MAAAPKRITQLALVTPLATDQFPIARGIGPAAQTFRTTVERLLDPVNTGLLTLSSSLIAAGIPIVGPDGTAGGGAGGAGGGAGGAGGAGAGGAGGAGGTSGGSLSPGTVNNDALENRYGLSVMGRDVLSNGPVVNITGTDNQVLRVNNTGTHLDFGQLNIASDDAVVNKLQNHHGGAGSITGMLAANNGTVRLATHSALGTDYFQPGETVFCNAIFSTGDVSVVGNVIATQDVVAFNVSDKRLKQNIVNIPNALDKVSKINGVEFVWNEELQTLHKGKAAGVIAQEVEEVLPTAVNTREDGYKAVKYESLIPLLLEAIKELKEEVRQLKSRSS